MATIELQTDRLRRETQAERIQCLTLYHNVAAGQRLALLNSVQNNAATPQAVAFTALRPKKWTPEVARVDAQLQRHKLMGETFRFHGFTVRQNRLTQVRLPLMSRRLGRLYGCSPLRMAAVECYEFWADTTLYGIVIEIKNPSRRQSPDRPAIGSSATLQRRGYTTSEIITYMDTNNKPRLATGVVATMAGVILSLGLFIQARRQLTKLQ